MRDAATSAITLFSAAMIIAAVSLTGGPSYARKERRDEVRLSDIRALAAYRRCMETGEAVACGQPPRTKDPFTGTEYGAAKSGDVTRICGDFETRLTNVYLPYGEAFSDDGCLVFTYESP